MKHLVAEEAAGDVDLLTPYNNNLLAAQDLLGYDRGQPTKQMALAVNDDGGRGEGRHAGSVERDTKFLHFELRGSQFRPT